MGILNVTPDSFSDGGLFLQTERALDHARQMLEEGAQIIDIGGESTRPGADRVSEQEELDRVIPVIEKLSDALDVAISIDTSKPRVMVEACAAGASMINDVNALRADGAIKAAVDTSVPVCLMHMQGDPGSMQKNPVYTEVTEEVRSFLQKRVEVCIEQGIDPDKFVLDPGFGFGKTLQHNFTLLRELGRLKSLGFPVLAGLSRKSMIKSVLGLEADERIYASVALALTAVWEGADIVRVHDVRATREAISMYEAVYAAADE